MDTSEEDSYVIIEQKYIEDEGRYAYESIGYFRNGTVAQNFLTSHKSSPFSIFYVCDVAFVSDFKRRSRYINFSDRKGNSVALDTEGLMLFNSWFNDQESAINMLYTARDANVRSLLRGKAVCRCLKSMLPHLTEFNKEMSDALDYLDKMFEEFSETNKSIQMMSRMEEIHNHKHGSVFVNELASAIIHLCDGSYGYAIEAVSNGPDTSHFQSIIRGTITDKIFLSSLT